MGLTIGSVDIVTSLRSVAGKTMSNPRTFFEVEKGSFFTRVEDSETIWIKYSSRRAMSVNPGYRPKLVRFRPEREVFPVDVNMSVMRGA